MRVIPHPGDRQPDQSRNITRAVAYQLVRDELVRDVKISGSLGCRAHALVDFTILMDMGQVKSRVKDPEI